MGAVALASASTVEAATPVELHGALSAKGTSVVDASGKPVQLKGMSLFWSGWAGQFYNRRAVQWLAYDWKTSIVRCAMGVEGGGNYLDSANNGEAANLRRVDSVVQAAVDLGIYVIIDWHDHNAPDHQAKAVAFFQRMARRWGDRPNVLYEIYNEPHGAIAADVATGAPAEVAWTWAKVKAYSEVVIDSIRAIDPDNMVLVGTPNWAQDVDVASKSPIAGRTNLAYTLHFYAGTHGIALQTKAETALAKIPLFITEWGTTTADGGGGEDQSVYWSESVQWLDWADRKGLSWCNWSVVAKSEASAALLPGASPKGEWPDSMISNSGWYVRERLIAQGADWSVVAPIPESLSVDTTSLPGTVQAEGFTAQSGIATESGADIDGTDDVGWIENGDWADYVVRVPEAGAWYAQVRVASNTTGGRLAILVDGVPAETLDVAGTNGWQTWTTVVSARPIAFGAGLARVRLAFVGGTGSLFNLNWIAFTPTSDGVRGRAVRDGARWERHGDHFVLTGEPSRWNRYTLRSTSGRILGQGDAASGLVPLPAGFGGMAFLELVGEGRRAVLSVPMVR